MELKEGYKQTEVGIIPVDWNAGYIKKFASITTGGSDTQDKTNDGIYPFYVRSKKVKRINQYSFDGEAVLTSGDGVGVGKIFHYACGKFDFHQRVYCIYNFNKVDGKYFYLQFSSRFFDRVMSMTAKSSVDSVRMEMIADMKIPLPPTLTEQKAIATVLSDTDALIHALEKKIAKKKLIKKGVMQNLLEPKENWVPRKLRNVLKVRHGKNQKDVIDENGDYPILATGGKIGYANDFLWNKPSVLIGRKGTIDVPQYMNSPFWSVDTLFYTEIFKGFDAKFIFYMFCLIDWYSYNEASGVPSLNAKTIELIEKFFPKTLIEQQEIAQILSNIDCEIVQLEQKLSKYKELKQGMMQQLLTGKIRLVKPENKMQEENMTMAAEPAANYINDACHEE